MGKKKILPYLLPLILPYQIQKNLSSICYGHETSLLDPTISLSLLM